MYLKTFGKNHIFLVGLLVLWLASLRQFYRYEPLILLIIPVSILTMYLFIKVEFIKNILRTPIPIIIFFAINFCACQFLYPYVDGLKTSLRGSDQDDAVKVAASRLIQLRPPYEVKTYLNNPISPGPGWLILHAPFVRLDIYEFTSLIFLIVLILVMYASAKRWEDISIFTFFLAATPLYWELICTGSDLILVGILSVLICQISKLKPTKFTMLLMVIGLSLLATSRVPLIYFTFLPFFTPLNAKLKLGLASISTIIALSLNISFWLWSPDFYSPWHLIKKGFLLASRLNYLLIVAILLLVICYPKRREFAKLVGLLPSEIKSIVFQSAIMVPMAFADLITRRGDFQSWEGANYLCPLIVPFIYSLINCESYKKFVKRELS
jgi:hypothetical protein